MNSEALVQLALEAQSCSQKELAERLNVSPTQISKWKRGEYISGDMDKRLRALAKIGDMDPSVVLWAGSLEAAVKWEKLFLYLADIAREASETGYDTEPLSNTDLLAWQTFYVLREMGVTIPSKFPEELNFTYDIDSDDDDDEMWEKLEENPYSSLVLKIYKSLNDVYGFYVAYVSDLMDEDILGTAAENIEAGLIGLAASKVEVDPNFATNFSVFRSATKSEFEEWLGIVKDKAFRAGIPLRAELLNMVHASHDELGHEAERESLGVNSSRLHPDIYMNELLCGMRIIHQVLPAILKKLGIDEEFKLDTSDLHIG